MKRNLLLLKSNLLKGLYAMPAAFLLLALLSISTTTRAQVVYSMADPAGTTAAAGDAVFQMNYNGANPTQFISGATAGLVQPNAIALDGNNNRVFVSEGYLAGNAIKVVNATTGALIRTITSANSAYIKAMEYDVVNDWLYYTTEGGDVTVLTAADALFRVHADGSGSQTIATTLTKNPYKIALDVAGNKVYIMDVTFTGRSIKTIDLANGNAVTSRSFATSLNTIWDFAVDTVNGYIYYTCEGGNVLTLTTTDQLRRQNINGTGDVILISSFAYSPYRLALDIGNNRAYVNDSYSAQAKIIAVNLTNNTYSTVLSLPNTSTSPTLADIAVPDQPKVTTTAASLISSTSATLAGTLVYGYGLNTERGVVYSTTNTTPTVSDSKASMATNATNGAYSAGVTGLSPSTTYYARAYAVNGAGTTYGAVVTFSTSSNDANLSNLTISAGTLTPGFSSANTSYTALVANANSTITITPTKNNANASIQVNNIAATSGSGSSVNLSIGDNAIPVKVTAQDGTTTKTYTITFTRPKAAQTITFASTASKTFGNPDFAAGASASSGLTVSYTSSNTGVATVSGSTIHIVGAGTSTITASQAGDASYLAATNATQTLTVDKATQTITFNALAAKAYGNVDFAPGASASSGLGITYASSNTAVATIVSNQVHIVGQGTANITASQSGDANRLAATDVVQSLTVNKATVTVTAIAQAKIYGDNDPTFTYTATGVVGTDAPTGALSRLSPTTNVLIGTYAIDQGTLSYGGNYNITYTGANLTINKRPITVLPTAKTKVYGDADPFLNQFQITAGSLAPGDGTGDQYGRAAGESVGSYLITLGTKKFYNLSNSTEVTANYDVTVQPAYVTITAKPITVNANAQTKTYGDADPALTYNNTSLAFSDSFSGALTRAAGEGFGTYAISKGTLALSSNYTLTFNGNNLTIGKKTINVVANEQSITYGDPLPPITYTADALATGDSFTGQVDGPAGTSVGTYYINQGSLALSANYTLNFTPAPFHINKKEINVIAVANSKTYGDTDPAFTYTADALVGTDSFSGSLTRDPGETAGTYAINQGSLDLNGNYHINYTGANLTIGKRDIAINAYAQNVPYGDADPAIGYSTTGNTLVDGDAFTGALGREPGTAVGTYAITQNTLTVSNSNSYNLTFNSAAYNIIPRPITVSSPFTVKIYGDADPALTYSITSGSLLSGDVLSGSVTRDAGEIPGPYAVRQGTVAVNSPNYAINFQLSNFEIDRAPLTVTADNKTRLVGQPNPTFTYTINGFKNGDTEASFPEAFQTSSFAASYSPAGTYPISVYNPSIANYDVTYVSGTLTVREASTNANLTALSVAGYTISPSFDPDNLNYTLAVAQNVSTIDITGTLADANAKFFRIGSFNAVSGQPNNVSVFPGENQISVFVTAEDNSTSKEYVITVTRPYETDATLSALSVSEGTLSPAFSTTQHNYTVSVASSIGSIVLNPVANSTYGFIKINGSPVETGYSPPRSLNPGNNVFNIQVSAQDRTITETYTVIVNRKSNVSTLDNLIISSGTLTPAFDSGTISYSATADINVSTIRLTPTATSANATVTVKGVSVTSGNASGNISLVYGANAIPVVVTAQDGSTSKTYTITVTRPIPSSNASLAAISLSPFSALTSTGTDAFSTAVINSVSSITVTATVKDATATVTVNGTQVASGTASAPIALNVGINTITVTGKAQDGTTTRTYTIKATRAPSSNAGLASISLSPVSTLVSNGTDSYTTSVANGISSVTVKPLAKDATATITVNGLAVNSGSNSAPITLGGGATVITTIVKAQDGTTIRTYSITVNKAGSSNTGLASIKLSPPCTLTAIGSDSYFTSVQSDVTSVTLTPTAKDANATIKVNGTTVSSGTASGAITLNTSGATIINTVITAQDGTTHTYALTVNKNGSSIANLAAIVLEPFTPLTITGEQSYSSNVPFSTGSITLTPTVKDANATIKVNGATVSSGTASPAITLNVGNNTITIVTLAQDAVTTLTYTVIVNRAASDNAGLASILLNPSSPLVASGDNFSTSVPFTTSSVTVKPTAKDANATIKVNGTTVSSGSASSSIALNVGTNTITIGTTAQDGTTTRVFVVTVTRAASNNAGLASILLSPYSTLQLSGDDFSTSVPFSTGSVTVKPTAKDANATIKVNGITVSSGVASSAINLNVGTNTITIIAIAQDGTTTRTYNGTVTRQPNALAINKADAGLLFANKAVNPVAPTDDDGVVVHKGVSPNGDGSNDFLTIEGIAAYSGNKLSIMNSSGSLVFETKNYGKDGSNLFDGHSSKNGTLLKPGTYFYSLEYKAGKEKRKTGYIILKY
jgi:gliding motility-associated-like protein